MPVVELTELQYREVGDGPWRLYLYGHDGFHCGARWFRLEPLKYPDEEITPRAAQEMATVNMIRGHEVRVTDSGDFLCFHAKDGKVVYGKDFWSEVNSKNMNRSAPNEENA